MNKKNINITKNQTKKKLKELRINNLARKLKSNISKRKKIK